MKSIILIKQQSRNTKDYHFGLNIMFVNKFIPKLLLGKVKVTVLPLLFILLSLLSIFTEVLSSDNVDDQNISIHTFASESYNVDCYNQNSKILIGITKGRCKNYEKFISFLTNIDKYQNKKITYIELESEESEFSLNEKIKHLDGIILSDGCPINPEYYGENSRYIAYRNKNRDNLDFCLLEYAKLARIPVLGICRGFSVINVLFGGALRQGNDISIYTEENRYDYLKVILRGEKMYFECYNPEFDKNTQIKRLGMMLEVIGRSCDGDIQCIMVRDPVWFAIGINMNPISSKMNEKVFIYFYNKMLEAVLWRKQTPLYKIINIKK